MKTVMDEARTEYSNGKINNRFKQFADDYGFVVHPCIAGRARTKAKVEAPMKILDEIKLITVNWIITSEMNSLSE